MSTTWMPVKYTGQLQTSVGLLDTPTPSMRPSSKAATTVLYEGKPVGTPDPGAFWRVIAQHGVSTLFTAPTVFRAIKREDPNGDYIRKYDLSHFRALFLAGERCDPDTLLWAQEQLKRPGNRPLVADGNRLARRGKLHRY